MGQRPIQKGWRVGIDYCFCALKLAENTKFTGIHVQRSLIVNREFGRPWNTEFILSEVLIYLDAAKAPTHPTPDESGEATS